MRLKRSLVSSCVTIMVALLIMPVALADQGVSPGWSGIGPVPIMPTWDGPNAADLTGLNQTTSISVASPGDVSPAILAPRMPISAPSGDTATFSVPAIGTIATAQAGSSPLETSPGFPPITLVATPNLGSTGDAPGTVIMGGTSVGYFVPPTPAGYWDNVDGMDLHTNMPMLDGPISFA